MSDADLLRVVSEHLSSFKRSVFRLEALNDYTSDAEDPLLRRWFAGEILPPRPDSYYRQMVRAARADGRSWQRVHAVTGPTPYLRFEMAAFYAVNEEAGEKISVLQHPDLGAVFGEPPPDFWLFDDATVIVMKYDTTNRIAAVPIVTDSEAVLRFLRLRDVALRNAVPLHEYRAALRSQVIAPPDLVAARDRHIEAAQRIA